MSLNISSLYDNRQDSDVMIVLVRKINIYAHKLILRLKSPVLNDRLAIGVNTLSFFPSVDDEVIILAFKHIYGIPIGPILPPIWSSLIKFCHDIKVDYSGLLGNNMPADIHYTRLIELAYHIGDDKVMHQAIGRVIACAPNYFDGLRLIPADSYVRMRHAWLSSEHSKYTLLMADCHYCRARPEANGIEMLGDFITDIPLAQFSPAALTTITREFPMFADIPLLGRLIKAFMPSQ